MDGNRTATNPKASERSGNCRFLLGGLVALLLAFPFLEDVASPLVLVISLAGVFVAGVISSDSEPLHVRWAIAIAGIQVGLTLVSLVQREANTTYWIFVVLALVSTVALILFSTYCVLRYVMQARIITRDQIYAGVCMYLMLGFAFGALFYLMNILDPKSFAQNVDLPAGDTPDLMYFSFVTLATLGYGDITPGTRAVRSLAVLEALVGMLYIAVFMARLVSLRTETEEMPVDQKVARTVKIR